MPARRSDLGERASAALRGAALYALPERGVIRVAGADRARWLNGMLSNDVARIAPGAGVYALLLTRQGRIVADLHVLALPEALLMETARAAVAPVVAHLQKFIVADDVSLADASEEFVRFALEGPAARAILAEACGRDLDLEPEHFADVEIGGGAVRIAAFAFTGGAGFQLIVPAAAAPGVERALRAAGDAHDLVAGDADLFELLRIEAGTPLLGCELDESVLPDEAHLAHAISTTKGCYTGQEVVTRMRSRGRQNHLLVGLALQGAPELPLPPRGTEIRAEEQRAGEITSAVRSPRLGRIALGFVRSEHAEPGSRVELAGEPARVVELPFPPHAVRDARPTA